MKKFFIMTRGRTGSTAIIDELGKLENSRCTVLEPFIKCDFVDILNKRTELIEQLQIMLPFELWKTQGTWWKKFYIKLLNDKLLIDRYLNNEESSAIKGGANIFGFKVLSHHFEETHFLKETLLERGYKAIYLKRNIPRQVISGMIANQRGLHNAKNNYQDNCRYQIDIEAFKNLVTWETQAVENDIAFLKAVKFDFIEVSYEEFMKNRQFFFERVLEFLTVPMNLPQASSYSVMIKDLEHTVANYQAVLDSAGAMGMRIE